MQVACGQLVQDCGVSRQKLVKSSIHIHLLDTQTLAYRIKSSAHDL